MFHFMYTRQKPIIVEDLKAEECSKISISPRVDVPEAPAATAREDTTKSWWYRLFGRPKTCPEEGKRSVTTSEGTNAAAKPTVKKPWKFCQWWKKKNRVTPAAGQKELEVIKNLTEEGDQNVQKKRKAPPGTTTEPPKKKFALAQEPETTTKPPKNKLTLSLAVLENNKRKLAQEPGTTTEPPKKKLALAQAVLGKNKRKLPQEPETTTEPPKKKLTLALAVLGNNKRKLALEPGTTTKSPKKKLTLALAVLEKNKRKLPQESETTTEPPKKKVALFREPESITTIETPKMAIVLAQKPETTSTTETPTQQQEKYLGFPNPNQICYMNSCLQSLLTLVDFVEDINRQEQIWSLDPEATLIQAFLDIQRNHDSSSGRHKFQLLTRFHTAVSERAPEFRDLEQKDAHEFLIAVLNQIRWRGPQLNIIAASMDTFYSCPVVDHMLFTMQNTRTCKSCGAGFTIQEEFTNLSLDLPPGGGTVEQMIEDYQRETQLEYRCVCGANISGTRSSFINLPRVLILHLKRFQFTPTFTLQKCHDPVTLQKDLVVSSKQGACCYSLVSIISHIGKATNGHYISDGVDPELGQGDPVDRWYTYNDAKVIETRGASVCHHRKQFAYILFYKKQE